MEHDSYLLHAEAGREEGSRGRRRGRCPATTMTTRTAADERQRQEDRLPDRLRARFPGPGARQPAARPAGGGEAVPRQGARGGGQEGVAGAGEAGGRLVAGPGERRGGAADPAAADAAAGQPPTRRSPRAALAKLTGVRQERRPRAGLPRARRARERQPALRRERDGVREDRARRIARATSWSSRCRRRRSRAPMRSRRTLYTQREARSRQRPQTAAEHRGQGATDVRVHATRPSTT